MSEEACVTIKKLAAKTRVTNNFILIFQFWPAQNKSRIFYPGSPSVCKYFPNIFFSISSSKIFAAVYLRVCSTGPLTFSHPSASLLELQLNRAIKNVCLLWMINLDQIYARKWNWPTVVSKYSIWNNSYLPKMGGEVVILANSLISHFQWGLRHSALYPQNTLRSLYRDISHNMDCTIVEEETRQQQEKSFLVEWVSKS